MKNLVLTLIAILVVSISMAQESRFFTPLQIKNAYNNGTRSIDGKPGENYWQNTADYNIQIAVDPSDRSLTGSETIIYYNNSPKTLNSLVIRLYYDVFKKGNQRLMNVDEKDVSDGVELTNIKINDQEYTFGREMSRSNTNLNIQLKEPLDPGKSLTFSCSWKQVVPLTVRRTGAIDSTSYFIAYWYPQVSVYDDVFGWDRFNYTFQTEMYNNLGNYDVTISTPDNFTVWATGVLQNPSEIMSGEVLSRYEKAKKSDGTVHIISPEDLTDGYKHSGKAWHFVANEVSDFAFATSDHFAWDAANLNVDGKPVFISTAFPVARVAEFGDVTAVQQKAMGHFSKDFPGVPYPYPAFTTFIGLRGGGMEFPMMANNGGPGKGVTIHEMFHTYFPMYVRTNEHRFAWMDEGWADYVTSQVTNRYFEENDQPVFAGQKVQMQSVLGTYSDLPLITSTQFMDGSNYGYASYPLPSFVYSMLNHHLGDEMFLKSLQTYINRWAKKSPTPYDFFYTFEDVSGQDLGWLWKPWFFEFGYPDIALGELEGNKLTVKKNGSKPVPVKIDITYDDDTEKSIIESAKVWANGSDIYIATIENPEKVKSIVVNREIPDVTELDNFYPSLGEIYAKLDIPKDLTGSYKVNEFPVVASVEEKDGALYFNLQGTGLATYLYPITGEKYESLDGSIKLEFVREGDVCSGLNFTFFGYNLTSSKQ